MKRRNKFLSIATSFLMGASVASNALAADKPAEIKIGISAFLTGPASVFGEPAKAAAEMIIEDINANGGIGGVPVKPSFIDEGAGGEALLAEYRRLVQSEGADVMMSAISSGNCKKIAPLAEDLKVLNIMWDCGTQTIFEEAKYRYVFRTQGNATPETLSAVLYLLKNKPDFKTIAVVNQDYAWGRDSWNIFKTSLESLKPGVEVVAEFFPKFGTPDFSAEISRLQAMRPDVIVSTSWGADLNTFVKQASQRGLTKTSTFVLPLAESSIQRLGSSLGEGHIIGGRGDHYFLHPERKNDADFKKFSKEFKAKTGDYPIYSVYHMAQALAATKGAYEKALKTSGGEWPSTEQLVDAMEGLTFQAYGRPVTIGKDHQGIESMMMGTSINVDEYNFSIMDNMMMFDGAELMPPIGVKTQDWLKTLKPDFVQNVKTEVFKH